MLELPTSRGDVVRAYQRVVPDTAALLEEAPPFLCRLALQAMSEGKSIALPSDEAIAYTGDSQARLREIVFGNRRTVRVPDRLAAEVLSDLKLEGYTPAPLSSRRSDLLQRALGELPEIDAHAATIVASFVSMVCWVRSVDGSAPSFSSASFYEFPHCVFATDLAAFHISPDVRYAAASLQALQDNLLHEALHQQLRVLMLTEPLLALSPSTPPPKVFVPWRATSWDLEHALQALFVYSHLARFRAARLSTISAGASERAFLTRAKADASGARTALRSGILALPRVLTDRGRALCEAL
jgi:hypothetical protein